MVYWWLCTLILALPVIAWWAHEPRSHSGRHGGYGLHNMDFLSARLIWLQLPQSARSVSSRSQRWAPGMAPFPGVTSQPPGGTPAALDHFLLGKASIFSLLELIFILAYNASPKPPILPKALSTIMVFNTVLLLTKELISQPEKCDLGPTFYHVPTILKQLAW